MVLQKWAQCYKRLSDYEWFEGVVDLNAIELYNFLLVACYSDIQLLFDRFDKFCLILT